MAKKPGRNHGSAFKSKVGLEAIKEQQTVSFNILLLDSPVKKLSTFLAKYSSDFPSFSHINRGCS